MMTDFNSKKKEENRNGEDGEFSAKGILGTTSCGVSLQPAAKQLVKEGGTFKLGQQRDQTQLYPTPHCTKCFPIKPLANSWACGFHIPSLWSLVFILLILCPWEIPAKLKFLQSRTLPRTPILTGCLVQIGMGWSEVFVQCEHLDACGKNSYLFHCTVNRLPLG